MKKQLILVFMGLIVSHFAVAQVFVGGLRVGLSTTQLTPKDLVSNTIGAKVIGADYGLYAGLLARIKLGFFYIQPEILLNSSKRTYSFNNISSPTLQYLSKDKFYGLDLPLMLGLKLGPLRFQGGAVGSYTLTSYGQLTNTNGYQTLYKKFTYGYQAGVGIDIYRLIFDVKYEQNLSGMGDGFQVGGQQFNFDSRPTRLLFGLGYKF